jgi:hypothetical protein
VQLNFARQQWIARRADLPAALLKGFAREIYSRAARKPERK